MVTLLFADTPVIRRRHSLQLGVKHKLVEVAAAGVDVVQAPGELVWSVPQSLNLLPDDPDPVC